MQATKPVTTDNWDEHWDAYAATNALNPAQTYRQKLTFQMLALENASAPVRLLDLGSGSGAFAGQVVSVRPDAEILGLDLSTSGVELARRNVPGGSFFQQDFTRPMAIDAKFNKWATHVVCSEVLEHLDDPAAVLRNVRALMAPGCKVVITVPAGPMSAFDKHIGHRRHFTAQLLKSTLEQAGLVSADVRGAGFPFFNLYRLAVVARGKKLIEDAAQPGNASLPLSARATIRAFGLLFKLNTSRARLGWQLVATAYEPR